MASNFYEIKSYTSIDSNITALKFFFCSFLTVLSFPLFKETFICDLYDTELTF